MLNKTIILGVLDLSDPAVETPSVVAERVRRALPYVPASRLVLAPDCGMKYLPRESADGKMAALAMAAAELRGPRAWRLTHGAGSLGLGRRPAAVPVVVQGPGEGDASAGRQGAPARGELVQPGEDPIE